MPGLNRRSSGQESDNRGSGSIKLHTCNSKQYRCTPSTTEGARPVDYSTSRPKRQEGEHDVRHDTSQKAESVQKGVSKSSLSRTSRHTSHSQGDILTHKEDPYQLKQPRRHSKEASNNEDSRLSSPRSKKPVDFIIGVERGARMARRASCGSTPSHCITGRGLLLGHSDSRASRSEESRCRPNNISVREHHTRQSRRSDPNICREGAVHQNGARTQVPVAGESATLLPRQPREHSHDQSASALNKSSSRGDSPRRPRHDNRLNYVVAIQTRTPGQQQRRKSMTDIVITADLMKAASENVGEDCITDVKSGQPQSPETERRDCHYDAKVRRDSCPSSKDMRPQRRRSLHHCPMRRHIPTNETERGDTKKDELPGYTTVPHEQEGLLRGECVAPTSPPLVRRQRRHSLTHSSDGQESAAKLVLSPSSSKAAFHMRHRSGAERSVSTMGQQRNRGKSKTAKDNPNDSLSKGNSD
jgi:hypothetical protein